MTIYNATYNQKCIREVYQALEDGIFRDATFGRDLTVTRNLTVLGSITFGDASVDNFLVKGRVSTMTAAGDYVSIDATTYQYEEGFEIRYKVTDWADTYTLGSFTTAKFIVQNDEDGGTKTMRAIDTDARANDTTISDIGAIKSHTYIKGSTAGKTIGTAYGGESEVEFDSSCASRTITTQVVGHEIRVRPSSTALSDANLLKCHGLYITFTTTDGATKTLGTGLLIRDHPSDSGTRTLTKGIDVSIGCTTGISIDGTTTTGITIGGKSLNPISLDSIAAYDSAVASGTCGSIIKQNIGAVNVEGTIAGLVVKNYCDASTTMSGGTSTFSGLSVFLKHVASGIGANNSSILNLHLHTSTDQTVSKGIGIFQSGTQTITNGIYCHSGTITTIISLGTTSTYLLDLSDCSGANGSITSDSGTEATTWKARIKVKTDDGTDAWINCYSTSNEA